MMLTANWAQIASHAYHSTRRGAPELSYRLGGGPLVDRGCLYTSIMGLKLGPRLSQADELFCASSF